MFATDYIYAIYWSYEIDLFVILHKTNFLALKSRQSMQTAWLKIGVKLTSNVFVFKNFVKYSSDLRSRLKTDDFDRKQSPFQVTWKIRN